MQTLRKELRNPQTTLVPSARGGAARARAARRSEAPLRAAFTLVEMLMVIVIIGVLMGLAIPAFMIAKVRVIEARVATEIRQLESAIAAFKAKYGVEPPSKFTLYLTQAGWTSDPANTAIVRRIWPQFDFSMGDPNIAPGTPGSAAGTNYPLFWNPSKSAAGSAPFQVTNASGTFPGVVMNGSECLLFFLGGIVPQANTSPSTPASPPSGFAKNPIYPFAPMNAGTNAFMNREGPFFEMSDISRIKDLDQNGMNEWYDPIPNQSAPYLYFSSYEGSGYRVAELPTSNPAYTLVDVYRVWTPPAGSPTATVPTPGTATQTLPPQKATSLQIISPGYDGQYGSGGVFNAQLTNSGLTNASGAADAVAYDNITNFSGGRLKP